MLLLCVSIVYACEHNPYLCYNDDASPKAIATATKDICNSIGDDDCTCGNSTIKYCDLQNWNVDEFGDQCEGWGENWYLLDCEAEYD